MTVKDFLCADMIPLGEALLTYSHWYDRLKLFSEEYSTVEEWWDYIVDE